MENSNYKSLLELNFKNKNPFGTLLQIFKPEKKNIIKSLIVLFFKHSPALFIPIIVGNIINAIILNKPDTVHFIILNSVFTLVLLLQNIFTHTLFIKYLSKANRSVEHNLRFALVKRMQELSMSFHNSFESGRLQTKVLRDAESVEMLSRQLVNIVFTGILNVGFAITATILYNWVVALFFVLTVPMAVILTRYFQRRMALTNKEYRTQLERMSSRVNEMVQMIPITRAHAVEKTELGQMGKHLQKVKEKGMRLDVLNAIFGASTWVSFQLFQFICLLVTAYMAYKGQIRVGDVVMFQAFFAMIINSINMIIAIFPEVNRGFDSINSLGEVLKCPDIEANEGKIKLNKVYGNIKFENVGFKYDSNLYALNNFTLNVKAGECIAVVGESGSGKSTLMNLIIGYRRHVSGNMFIDNVNAHDIDFRSFRRFLAVVPQNIILFSGSIRENILYGVENDDITEEQLQKVIEMSRLNVLIDQLPKGLNTSVGKHGDKLSGGQKQRIAIARALIRDPKVIIFDEATSALDVESEKFIQDSINEMIRGRTTFIVAHRLSTIRKADRIVVLKDGFISEIGTHAELLELKGIYANMVAMQSDFGN
jgi:ATP-binding cassette subfamily B protein